MAAGFTQFSSNDKAGVRREIFSATVFKAAALATGTPVEAIIALPRSGANGVSAGNGWELIDCVLAAGANITHDTASSVTATVEKNTDGGTSALSTAPVLLHTAGTGRKTTRTAGTGITPAVIHTTQANRRFADDDVAFITMTGAGTGGADANDVSVQLTFARVQDFDPLVG